MVTSIEATPLGRSMIKRWRGILTLAAGAALATASAVAIVPYRAVTSLAQVEGWISESFQVQKELDDVLSSVRNAELHQRNYLLSKKKEDLAAFRADVDKMPKE